MTVTLKLEIDPIACSGHGLCADLLPELIELDEWGYPIIRDSVPPSLAAHARRAVSACPAAIAPFMTRSGLPMNSPSRGLRGTQSESSPFPH